MSVLFDSFESKHIDENTRNVVDKEFANLEASSSSKPPSTFNEYSIVEKTSWD